MIFIFSDVEFHITLECFNLKRQARYGYDRARCKNFEVNRVCSARKHMETVMFSKECTATLDGSDDCTSGWIFTEII